jgi:CDP-diacylglycerol--glycerol-3-phosphate 3-phosphatidyltransferase
MGERWLTFPNAVSLVRVLALPWLILALRDHDRPVLAGLILVVSASDFLDGWLARRLGQVSEFGKLLDPLADKICALACAVALVAYTDFPGWAMALIWGKDLLIAAGGAWISRREKIPVTPNFWGKAATFLEMLAFIIFAFRLRPLMTDVLAVMTGFIVLSFLSYVAVFIEVLRGRRTVAEIVAGYSAYGLHREAAGGARWQNRLVYVLIILLVARLAWLVATNWSNLL